LTDPANTDPASPPAGENQPPAPPAPTPSTPPPADGTISGQPPKTFSEEQLNRIVGTRAKEAEKAGKQAAAQEFADQLGVPVEKALEIIKASQEAEEAQKTELDKLREANESLKKDSESKLSKAQEDHHSDRVKLRLLKAGVSLPEDPAQADEKLDRIAALVRVPAGGSAEDIDTDITDNLKVQFPEFFSVPDVKPSGNVPSNPQGTPRQPSIGTKSPEELGREIAARANVKRGVVAQTN
jgi:hypothetical protein